MERIESVSINMLKHQDDAQLKEQVVDDNKPGGQQNISHDKEDEDSEDDNEEDDDNLEETDSDDEEDNTCGYMCDNCNNYVDGGDICECYKERICIARREEREEQRRFENTLSKNIDRYVRFVPTRKRVRRLATYTGGKKK